MPVLLILLCVLLGCAPHRAVPQLPGGAIQSSSALHEGLPEMSYSLLGAAPIAAFSLSPEALAAVLMQAARMHGWGVEPLAEGRPGGPVWRVTLNPPGSSAHIPVAVLLHEPSGSYVFLGDTIPCLPWPLLPPLRAAVAQYLSAPALLSGR